MALLKRNLYRNHRCHFAPGDQPPPAGFVTARDYAASDPEARFHLVEPEKTQLVPSFPFKRGNFAMSPHLGTAYRYPETFVLEMPRGRVLHSEGVVLTRDNRLLTEAASNFHRSVQDHRIFSHDSLPSLTFTDSRVAVIASLHADVYFHWMCNVIPRLELLQRSGVTYDWLYLPALSQTFQMETLRHLGVNLDRVIVGGRGLHLEAATLIVPSLPSQPCDFPPFVADFLRQKLLSQEPPRPTKRLYLSRAGAPTRQLLNEAELLPILCDRGFEPVLLESLSVSQQAQLFAQAEVIVAPHGASLTNLAFCQKGTHLIEIFHPRHICDCYWQVSHHLGLNHRCLMADRAYRNLAKRFNDRNHDMKLQVSQLQLAIDQLDR